ncbi:MAG TPA: hypothetical protein VGW57_15365 [Chthoniobacterales bacterium]|nr:hypothetical protein [Chthoniobacterales bacterium]
MNLLGIDADGKVHINRSLLEIHDGPTLQHALKNIRDKMMRQPREMLARPNREYLAARFEMYLKAG